MMNLDLDIVGLKRSQINEASEVLARAFNDDPMFRYLTFEGDRARANALKWFCKLVLRYSEPYNHIYTTASELKGIATWVPPGHFPLNMLRLLQVGLYALPFNADWRKLGRMKSLFDKMEEFHKRDMPHPHWYLFMLGVAPTYQGQGIGGLLLQPVLKQADSEGLPCYLETNTERAVRFYQKNGFEVVRMHEFAEGSPRLWTMKREPQKSVD